MEITCCICNEDFKVPKPNEDEFYGWAWKRIPNCIGYAFPCPECKEKYCEYCIEHPEEFGDCVNCIYKEDEA
jgi:hypothetical protein